MLFRPSSPYSYMIFLEVYQDVSRASHDLTLLRKMRLYLESGPIAFPCRETLAILV